MAKKTTKSNKTHLKQNKSLKDSPSPPLPFARHIIKKDEEKNRIKELERILSKEGPLTLSEASVLIEDLKQKKIEIKNKLDEIFRKRGTSPEDLRRFLSNPSNFSPKQWEKLKKYQQSVFTSFDFPPNIKIKNMPTPPVGSSRSNTASKGAKITKEPQRRKLGSGQRRGWLPMR